MIKTEHIRVNERDIIRTYSDSGYKIRGGVPESDYDVAEDPAELGRTYTETDIPVEGDETAEEVLSMLEEAL